MQRPFRFGIQFWNAASRYEWQEYARRAEALGYDVFLIPDHVENRLAYGPALMAASDVTTGLHIASFVLDNDFRHPVFVASEAATLDLLSDGRFELGIGAGHLKVDYERSGIPFDAPGVRLARLKESVGIIKGLFGDEPVTFHGEHYRVTELVGSPKPVQRPHPPVLIGAGGPKALAFAAQEADIVAVTVPAIPGGGLDATYIALERVEQQVARVRAAAAARFDQIELTILSQRVVITDDRQAAAEVIAREWELDVEMVLDSPYMLLGSVDQIVEMLLERRERLGISYIVVFGRYVEEFAPVVSKLSGR
jgi:probable F420-dependent oxidoreductase